MINDLPMRVDSMKEPTGKFQDYVICARSYGAAYLLQKMATNATRTYMRDEQQSKPKEPFFVVDYPLQITHRTFTRILSSMSKLKERPKTKRETSKSVFIITTYIQLNDHSYSAI